MAPIELLLREVDRLWPLKAKEKIRLNLIGSGALMLQSDYGRATKDCDLFEVEPLGEPIRKSLLKLAGKESSLRSRLRMYLDIVPNGLPFLPMPPLLHPTALSKGLTHFEIHVLDAADVAVSKIRRFNANDRADIQAMIARGLVPHERLVDRFRNALDRFSMDARAELLPKYIERLHSIEQTFFNDSPTTIDLPDWMDH